MYLFLEHDNEYLLNMQKNRPNRSVSYNFNLQNGIVNQFPGLAQNVWRFLTSVPLQYKKWFYFSHLLYIFRIYFNIWQQKWRFSASQTHLWLIKVWFSASTFVVKIATFAKPENVISKPVYSHSMTIDILWKSTTTLY